MAIKDVVAEQGHHEEEITELRGYIQALTLWIIVVSFLMTTTLLVISVRSRILSNVMMSAMFGTFIIILMIYFNQKK